MKTYPRPSIITAEEFESLLGEIAALKDRIRRLESEGVDDLLTATQAAAYLRISRTTFEEWRRMRPELKAYYGPGSRSPRFRRRDLLALLTCPLDS